MGYTSIPCNSETRDRVKDLKTSGDTWMSYDDILEEMADAYEQVK